jgi:broad specificity phosphatase PhoE
MAAAGEKTIYVVRHGEATHNVDFEFHGEAAYFDTCWLDSVLTEKGEGQAKQCALPKAVQLLVVSPLRRAQQTAAMIGNPSSAPLVTLPLIREFPRGHAPNFWLGEPGGDHWPLGAGTSDTASLETEDQLAARLVEVRAWLRARDETVIALVSHGALLQRLMGRPADGPFLPHGECVEWTLAPQRVVALD